MEFCTLVCYLIETSVVKRSRTKVKGLVKGIPIDTDWTLVC